MTDWTYQMGAIIEAGRQARGNACLHYGLYPNCGLFVRALGASSEGPVTHWGVTPAARPAIGPLLPGATRVAAEYDDQGDVEVISQHGTSQTITRSGDLVAAWAVISHLQAGEWTVPLEDAWPDWIASLGLVEIHLDLDAEVDVIAQAQAAEPGAPDSGALETGLTAAIDAYLDEVGLDTTGRLNVLTQLGVGPAAAAALLM